MNRSLNHDFYDSLISSGKINYLEPRLQQPVQDIFKRIKMHNEFLDIVIHTTNQDNFVPKNTYKYYDWMDESEVILKKEIPIMLQNLKEHFKTSRKRPG